jgi:predicted amino acid-binding ACT domain protein
VAYRIRKVEYYYADIRDEFGAAYGVLSALAELGVNLLAFTAVPSGPYRAQFTIFPENPNKLVAEARMDALALDGPHHALLVQGDDELGAFADIHRRLGAASVDIYATSGVTDGVGSFGHVVYVREDQFEKAASALEL